MSTVQEALDRIWSDEALKQKLIRDPKPVLRGFGLNVSDSVSIQIHENTAIVINAVLPAAQEGNVSLPDTDPVAAIIQRAWRDEAFKRMLLEDPSGAAQDMGVRIPSGVTLQVWENTATVEHLVLPLNPKESELSDMELEAVAGGTTTKSTQSSSTTPQTLSCLSTGGSLASTLLKSGVLPVSSSQSIPATGK